MKPLSDDRKQKIFEDIVKSISYLHDLAPGEFTIQMIEDALNESGHEITRPKVLYRLEKLVDSGVLAKRKMAFSGNTTNAYSPIKDLSYNEILEALSD